MRNLILLSLSAFFLFSCKRNADVQVNDSTRSITDTNNVVYKYIKKLGYRNNEIEDIGKEYIVDGDILFDKSSNPDFSIFGGPKAEQYGTSNYIGYNVQPNIKIRIDPSMNAYTNEINGAIAMWNNVINSRIHLAITTLNDYNIYISNFNLGSGICGAARFPVNGLPGEVIQINITQIQSLPLLQRQSVIAHEIGHTLGFRHTNWQPLGEP